MLARVVLAQSSKRFIKKTSHAWRKESMEEGNHTFSVALLVVFFFLVLGLAFPADGCTACSTGETNQRVLLSWFRTHIVHGDENRSKSYSQGWLRVALGLG